jgi:hypothetical protein
VSTQNTFDIFLLPREGSALDARAVLAAIEGSDGVFGLRDPGRYLYRNDDTGVHFHVTVSPDILPRRRRDDESADSHEDEDGEEVAAVEEEEEPLTSDDDGDGDEEVEEPFDLIMAPVTLTLPLLVPGFFLGEAVELALRIAEASGLVLDSPAIEAPAEGTPAGGRTASEILAAWELSSRAAMPPPGEASGITTWDEKKAADWWNYGRHRALLEEDLAGKGISVPALRAAIHEGKVKSLFIWETGKPSVIPRTDLVLVRRERQRMGLLRMKRTVEEGIVPGPMVWDLLASSSELRTHPVEVLVYRKAPAHPSQVAADLEEMRLELVESVRRTELIGVVVAPAEAVKDE